MAQLLYTQKKRKFGAGTETRTLMGFPTGT